MSDENENDYGAGLDPPFEFPYHTGEGEQSSHRTSSEQYAAVNTEPADTDVGGNADFAERFGRDNLLSLSRAVFRVYETLVAEPFPGRSWTWYDTFGVGASLYLTDPSFADLDDLDKAADIMGEIVEHHLSLEVTDGVSTQVDEGAFAKTPPTGIDSPPDSATNAGTSTINPSMLHINNIEHLETSTANTQEIAADFADLVAGRVHSNHFGNNVLPSAGDIDISADLAELMAHPMSMATTPASSEAMSPASTKHASRTMSVASAEDISDTVSGVPGDDVDEVMSDAVNGPDFNHANEKGKGKVVESGEDGDNGKGKAPATPDAAQTHDDNGLSSLPDDRVDPMGLMPVTRPTDTANPFTFHAPNAVNPYSSGISTLYRRAHLAGAGARDLSEFWKKKLDENDQIFRDKRKELADLGIATTRRRNETRDAGGIMNKKNFENATPERKAYLMKTYDDDVKMRELTYFLGCEVDLFNQMADTMDVWKKIVLKLVATLAKMRTGTAMGMRGARENFFNEGEIYYLDNTEAILRSGYEHWRTTNESINHKVMTPDGREFAGDLEDFIEIQKDVRAARAARAEEGEKEYTTSDDEDESE